MSIRKKGRVAMELSPKELAALVKASKITEEEIQHWHADFLHNYPSGRLDKTAFINYYNKFYSQKQTNKSVDEIFDLIDIDKNGTVDFNEFLVIIVLHDHFTDLESRLSFLFDIWDESEDGQIDKKELTNMISSIYDRMGFTDRKGDYDPQKRAKEIIAKFDHTGDKKLSKAEFIIGCKSDTTIRNLLVYDT